MKTVKMERVKLFDAIRHKANVQINVALTNKWLDDETIRGFMHEQKILQSYPFSLQGLVNKIRNEIRSRVTNYGT